MKTNKIKEQTSLFCKAEHLPLKKGEVLKKNLGFTLFELLVSISIIAVLTAVAVVSFGGLNKKTRDTRRVSDLEKIRVALESVKQVTGTYPAAVGTSTNLTGYLDKWPVDPKNSSYIYVRPTTSTYYICSTVELSSSISSDVGNCNATLGTVYAGYYKVTQP